jgi:hypothetical protein
VSSYGCPDDCAVCVEKRRDLSGDCPQCLAFGSTCLICGLRAERLATFEPVDSSRVLADALADARRNRSPVAGLTASQVDDLVRITELWNSDRKRRGLAFNMTPGQALTRLLTSFREDLEALKGSTL